LLLAEDVVGFCVFRSCVVCGHDDTCVPQGSPERS
jgi:hypothetical protein